MEFVVKDIGGSWYFDDNKYICKNNKGDLVGKMYAEYIPDPVKMWESKCEAANVKINSDESIIFKPNDVVFKLWEHKNANFNA